VLGLGHPGFWLLGLGLEVAYLFGFAFNPGFQKWVQIQEHTFTQVDEDVERQVLVRYLSPGSRDRLQSLEQKCKRIIEMQIVGKAEGAVLEANRVALVDLMWVCLKLLVAEQSLHKPESGRVEQSIRQEINTLEHDLHQSDISHSVRESKQATLNILEKRLRNIERRDQYLAETQSNLKRIEAQIDLAMNEVEMQGRPEFISTDIEIAGSLLSDLFYGDAEATIAEIERGEGARASAAAAARLKE